MKERIIRFFKNWTLPLGMFGGVAIYLMFHYIPLLSPLKVLAKGAEEYVMPLMVFIQLFTTFCKVNPREMMNPGSDLRLPGFMSFRPSCVNVPQYNRLIRMFQSGISQTAGLRSSPFLYRGCLA